MPGYTCIHTLIISGLPKLFAKEGGHNLCLWCVLHCVTVIVLLSVVCKCPRIVNCMLCHEVPGCNKSIAGIMDVYTHVFRVP